MRLPSGHVLVMGGAGYDGDTYAEVYDPVNDTWTPIDDRDDVPDALAASNATVLASGKVLVTGGDGWGGYISAAAHEFDLKGEDWPNASWTVVNDMPVPRSGGAATLLPSGKVLLTGAAFAFGSMPGAPAAILYDPTGFSTITQPPGTWSLAASTALREQHAQAWLDSDRLMVPLLAARHHCACCAIGGNNLSDQSTSKTIGVRHGQSA